MAASKVRAQLRALIIALVALSAFLPCKADADSSNWVDITKTFTTKGEAYYQTFNIPVGGPSFYLDFRFAHDDAATCVIISSADVQAYLNGQSVTTYSSLDGVGMQRVTLGGGAYALLMRNNADSANQACAELNFYVGGGIQAGSVAHDEPIQNQAYVNANGGYFYQTINIQSGYRYWLDGCNSGLSAIYLMPPSEFDHFKNNLNFAAYPTYGSTGQPSDVFLPGGCELALAPGTYYLLAHNLTAIPKAWEYDVVRYQCSDAGFSYPAAATSVVIRKPTISNLANQTAKQGVPFSYQITATNAPTSFSADHLPPGLSVNTATGVIAGTPTQAGTYTFQVSGTNSAGTATATLVLTVASNLPTLALTAVTPVVLNQTGNVGEFLVSLSARQDHDVIVNFRIAGSAVNGRDYATLKASKRIKAGQLSKLIKIKPLGVSGAQKRDVRLTLQAQTGFQIGTTATTVSIMDYSSQTPALTHVPLINTNPNYFSALYYNNGKEAGYTRPSRDASGNVTGLSAIGVVNASTKQAFELGVNSLGLPEQIQDTQGYLTRFSNYTATTVDVTFSSADGSQSSTVKAVALPDNFYANFANLKSAVVASREFIRRPIVRSHTLTKAPYTDRTTPETFAAVTAIGLRSLGLTLKIVQAALPLEETPAAPWVTGLALGFGIVDFTLGVADLLIAANPADFGKETKEWVEDANTAVTAATLGIYAYDGISPTNLFLEGVSNSLKGLASVADYLGTPDPVSSSPSPTPTSGPTPSGTPPGPNCTWSRDDFGGYGWICN